MIILISGASHTGKTQLAQKLLNKFQFPYLSLDHLKMGLIRSGETSLTVYDDEKLTPYLFSIASQMIKTAIENKQNLIVEGCYIPYDYQSYFTSEELEQINYVCLIMSSEYIQNHFDDIISFESVIEQRKFENDITIENLIRDNENNLKECKAHDLDYYLIEEDYNIDIENLLSWKFPF